MNTGEEKMKGKERRNEEEEKEELVEKKQSRERQKMDCYKDGLLHDFLDENGNITQH